MTGKPRQVGMIGAGWISTVHLEAMKRNPDRAVAAAICDPNPETLDARAAEFGVPRKFSSVAEMLASGSIDAAVVGSPSNIRHDVVAPLLDAGIPVLIEKPLSETYGEAAMIAAKSTATGVPAAVNQSFRRGFSFAIAREVLRSGECGRPLHLTHITKRLRRDKGWRLTRNRYAMTIMSVHWFDGYRWLLGEEPESVYCRGVNSPLTDGGDDTAISAILTFPSGTVVCLSESFSSFCGTDVASLDCEKKSISLGGGSITVVGPDEKREVKNRWDNITSSWHLLDNLLTAHENGLEPETSVQDNLNTMRILEAAYRSFQEKRQVRLEEIK